MHYNPTTIIVLYTCYMTNVWKIAGTAEKEWLNLNSDVSSSFEKLVKKIFNNWTLSIGKNKSNAN